MNLAGDGMFRSLRRLAKSSRAGLKMRVPARGDDTGTANRFGDLIADRLGTIIIRLARHCSPRAAKSRKVAAFADLGPRSRAFGLSKNAPPSEREVTYCAGCEVDG